MTLTGLLPLRIATAVFAGALLAAGLQSAHAGEALPAPSGPVVLTVSGEISRTTDGSVARFDMAMLESLPSTSFRTATIWTEGESEFTGVELDDLLAHLGARGAVLRAVALNDYKVEIPASDAVDGGPIIAYRQDGAHISRREKGPLWVVYPYDSNGAYRSEVTYSRSIWQLDRLEVID